MAAIDFRSLTESKTITSTTSGSGTDKLVTVPDNHMLQLEYLIVSNEGNQNKTISVEFYHKEDDTWHHLVKTLSVAANSFETIISGANFYMHAGDQIGVHKYNASDTFSATASGRLYYTPNRFT